MPQVRSIYRSEAGRQEIMALYERVLGAWPVPFEHLSIPTRHGATFVISSGDPDAPPLVLLHGSGSNSATWAHDVVAYSQCCRVYAVDIPGEPGKSAENRFSCRGPAFREWLGDVLDGLGLWRVILGGMSLGAWAALDYGVHTPERVESLVLLCPSGICPVRPSFGLNVLLCGLLGDKGLERMKKLIFKDVPLTPDAERFFMLVGMHFNYRREAPSLFTDDQLRRVTMPVLFLAGEHDVLLPARKTAGRLAQLLPCLTARVLEEDGHAVIDMAPEVVTFLQSQAPLPSLLLSPEHGYPGR